MASWRAQGGKSRLEQANSLNTNTIVADKFILRDYFYGDLLVQGNIKTPQSIIANANVVANMVAAENIFASASIRAQQDITLNGNLFVNGEGYFQKSIIHGTTTKQAAGNVITILNNDPSGNYFFSQAILENVRYGTLSPYYAGSFGFNSATPRATLDVLGTLPQTMHLHADVPATYSVLASNNTDVGIVSLADTGKAAVQFYQTIPAPENDDKEQLPAPASMAPDAAVTYEVESKALVLQSTHGGIRFVTDQGITFASTHSPNTSVPVPNAPLSKKDALVVYDVADGHTFWPTVFDPSFSGTANTGRGVSIVGTQDQTSLSFALATNTSPSFVHSFGNYPLEPENSLYAVTYHDANGSLFPAWSTLSQDTTPTMRTRHAFNNATPSTDEYVVEINGPLLLRSGEVHVTLDVSFVVLGYATQALDPGKGILFGEPYTTAATALTKPADGNLPAMPKPYVESVVSTRSAGITWTPYPFDSPDIDLGVEYTPFTTGAVIDDALQIVVSSDATGNATFTYYSMDGGLTWAGLNTGDTFVHHSVCAVRYNSTGVLATVTQPAASYRLLFCTPTQIGYTNRFTLSELSNATYTYAVYPLSSSGRTAIQAVMYPGSTRLYVVYNTDVVEVYDTATTITKLASVTVSATTLLSLSLLSPTTGRLCTTAGHVYHLTYNNPSLVVSDETATTNALESLLTQKGTYRLRSFIYQPDVHPDLTLVVLAHQDPSQKKPDQLFYACDKVSPLTFREIDAELVLQAGGPSSWGHGTIANVTVMNDTDIQVIQVLEPRALGANQAGRSRVVYLSFPALFSTTTPHSLDVAHGHAVVQEGHVSARNGFMRPANAEATRDTAAIAAGEAVNVVNSIVPKTFSWKSDGKEDVGFLYEDVAAIVPEAVDTQTQTVDYTKLMPYLWKVVQELAASL